jgi:Transposase DDE domain
MIWCRRLSEGAGGRECEALRRIVFGDGWRLSQRKPRPSRASCYGGGRGRVHRQGQGQRGVFGAIKRELRRRSAIEPVIGHMKAEGHLGRCYLKGTAGDAANAILTAVGYNFRRILAWLRILLCLILAALWRDLATHPALKLAC